MKREFTRGSCETCKAYHQSVFCNIKKNRPITRRKMHFNKGDQLYKEDAESEGVFCIKSGLVEITKKDNFLIENTIGIARPGELLGASSLMLNKGGYSTTAIAQFPVEACFISKSEMTHILSANPKVAMNLLVMLAEKLGEQDPHFQEAYEADMKS